MERVASQERERAALVEAPPPVAASVVATAETDRVAGLEAVPAGPVVAPLAGPGPVGMPPIQSRHRPDSEAPAHPRGAMGVPLRLDHQEVLEVRSAVVAAAVPGAHRISGRPDRQVWRGLTGTCRSFGDLGSCHHWGTSKRRQVRP